MQDNTSTSVSRKILMQDTGLLLFMLSILAAALITALAGKDLIVQNAVMLLALGLSTTLVVMRARVAGTVVTGATILFFTVYKLYRHLAYLDAIEWTAYGWPFVQLIGLGGMAMFISLYSTIEGVNGLLNQRLDELTVMDPLTGLENMRSMVASLKRYMALCERNGTQMGLMMVRLRYAEEIKKVLTRAQFNDLRHMLALTVQDVLRLEDRVFSLDENGSMGVIYFSAESGAEIVKHRIINAIAGKNMLPDLNEQMLTVEMSVVYKHYTKDLGKDATKLVSEVEKEFAYEV